MNKGSPLFTIEESHEIALLIAEKQEYQNKANEIENKIIKMILDKIGAPTTQKISETLFSDLQYAQRNTPKLGTFELADNDNSQQFNEAFKILDANQAKIDKRFHPDGFIYAYWLYGGRIYRQILKNK